MQIDEMSFENKMPDSTLKLVGRSVGLLIVDDAAPDRGVDASVTSGQSFNILRS